MYYLRRFLALQIDCIIAGLLFSPIFIVLTFTNPNFFGLIKNEMVINFTFATIIIVYYVAFDLIFGKSIGKKIFKIKVVKKDGSPLTKFQLFSRNFLRFIDLTLFITLFIVFLKRKQSIPDIIVKTIVIEE